MRWGRRAALFVFVGLAGLVTGCSGDDEPSGGGGDADQTEADAEGEGESAVCSREELSALAEDYFGALAAHEPEQLPLADDVKFTEDGQEMEPGEGLWQTAGPARFTRTVVDTEQCGSHTQAVVPDGGAEVLYGVRLRLDEADGEITEMETYVAREEDYFLFSPDGLVESDTVEGPTTTWDAPVPEASRLSRQELADIADSYFESFGPAGYVAPMRTDCWRWENGRRTTAGDCIVGLPPEGTGRDDEMITNRRYPVADPETGVVVGYVRFAGSLDFHMFKIVDGQILLITAVVAGPSESTGWEEQE